MNTLINVHINCYNYLATGTVEAASGAGKGRRPTGAGNASMGVVVAGGGGGGWSDRGRLLRAAAMANEAISQSACVMSSDSSSPPHYLVDDCGHPCCFVCAHTTVICLFLHTAGVTHKCRQLWPFVGQQVGELKEDKYIITLFRFSIDITDSPATSATHTFGT